MSEARYYLGKEAKIMKQIGFPEIEKKKYTRQEWQLFFLVLPFMIILFLLAYVPVFGWIISLYDYRPGIPLFENDYIGLKYFKSFLQDRDVLKALKNTAIFSGISFILTPLPMLFAVCLNEISSTRYRKLVQTATTLPHFISWVILYSFVFAMVSNDGVVNKVGMSLGLFSSPIRPLQDEDIVYGFQIALMNWKGLGWASIIYIAAIAGIEQEQYEAALIDGAGRFKTALYITIPNLLPTFVVLLLMDVSNFVNTGYEQYFVFKNAFVYDKIEVLDLYIYRMGLQLGDYSYATAVGIMKSFISITLLFVSNAIAKKVRGEAIV